MEREQDQSMIQQNNGAIVGTGQPKKGMGKMGKAAKKNKNKASDPTVMNALGVAGAAFGQPKDMPFTDPPVGQHQTMPVGGPQQFQPPSAPPGGPQANPQTPSMDDLQARLNLGGYQGTGNMLGFNTNLDYDNDSAKGSMKNVFGQIASRYKAAPSMLDAVMNDPQFKQFFPNARKVEGGVGDKIDFGGQIDWHSGAPVGVVDVGGAFDPANDSGAGWTWQDLANDMMGQAPGQAIYEQTQAQVGTPGGAQMTQMLEQFDEQTLMQILEALMQQDPSQQGY